MFRLFFFESSSALQKFFGNKEHLSCIKDSHYVGLDEPSEVHEFLCIFNTIFSVMNMKKYQIIDGLCNLVIISGLPLDETYHE